MESTFPLPLECLQLVIGHLLHQFAHKSAVSLLCVNKYVCAAALPILYQDPFDQPPLIATYKSSDKNHAIILRLVKLVQVLLRSLPSSTHHGQDLITELMHAAYFNDQDQQLDQNNVKVGENLTETARQDKRESANSTLPSTLSPTLLPYSSFMTKITFEEIAQGQGRLHFTMGSLLEQPNIQGFLKRTGRSDQYLAEQPFRRLHWCSSNEYELFAGSAERDIRRDLAWALCCSNAERIQTLHIPLTDVERYLALIPRLNVLSEVVFHFTEDLTCQNAQRLNTEENELWSILKEDRKNHLEKVLLFVQDHQYHHPNTLRTARCANDRYVLKQEWEEHRDRLLQLLPPLVQPLYLDDRNWDQFATHVSETDLSLVRTLRSLNNPITAHNLGPLTKQKPFLHRCQSLKRLFITSFDEDIFKWAVQERTELDDAGIQSGVTQQALAPLQDYIVEFDHPSSGRQASDVVYAFGNTLQNIQIVYNKFTPSDDNGLQSFPEFALGGGFGNDRNEVGTSSSWPNLPKLRLMRVHTDYMFIRLHPAFFARSPRLFMASMEDKRGRYSLSDVVCWEPAVLPELVYLSLAGTSAISFHPDTLKSTNNLVRLELRMFFQEEASFIPDPEEFDQEEITRESDLDESRSLSSTPTPSWRRPLWTWDWDLPKLTYLCLTSEFAYRFQFRMLDSTPSLTNLFIDFNSITQRHSRILRIADLFKPGFQHSELPQFLKRDQQLHLHRRQLLSAKVDEACLQRQREEEDEDKDEDEKLWSKEFAFVHVPYLEEFVLTGQWVVDYRVLKALFSKVAPRIDNLSLGECYGFTISEWVKATADHLHELQKCHTRIPFNGQLAKEAGLLANEARFGSRKTYKLAERPTGRVLDTPATYGFLV
ncbi:hypothetical protein BGX24_006422 [Mortierella sp. AD032]|nr:hypothetical protein BGX24_006422 [Mortierella sp. AD032]